MPVTNAMLTILVEPLQLTVEARHRIERIVALLQTRRFMLRSEMREFLKVRPICRSHKPMRTRKSPLWTCAPFWNIGRVQGLALIQHRNFKDEVHLNLTFNVCHFLTLSGDRCSGWTSGGRSAQENT